MRQDTASRARDVLFATIPLALVNTLMYGARPIVLQLVAMVFAWLFDWGVYKLRREPLEKYDFTGAVTGAVLVMFLPVTTPYWMVVVGVFIGIVLAKHAFGGYGNNIFNPAAVGVAFISLFWPATVSAYPRTFTQVPLVLNNSVELVSSPLAALKVGGVPFLDKIELFVGNYPSNLGGVSVLVVFSAGLFLLIRKTISWQLPVSFLSAVALFAYFFPRVNTSRLDSVFFELFSGALVFAAFFLVSDPVTAPKQNISKIIYGALFGLTTMLFRYFGAFEAGVCFAAIATNAIAAFIDRRVNLIQGRYTTSKIS